jgi:hypothetical protein
MYDPNSANCQSSQLSRVEGRRDVQLKLSMLPLPALR